MTGVPDFNYRVALADGLRHLQAGKLKQAAERFRYLVDKFPQADGGYRGLARVQIEYGETHAALTTLRDGAAALSRAGERGAAIDLLSEATTLDPHDLAAHRRLAAALALSGDAAAAATEHVRFAKAEVAVGRHDRARMEVSYALETVGELPELVALARELHVRADLETPSAPASPPRAPASLPAATAAPTPVRAAVAAAPSRPEAPMTLEERAMALLGARDESAGRVAIEATRALLAAGKVQAASDLLLAVVASGVDVHDAQRELIAISEALGRSDLARERARLLEEASRLG